MSNEMRIVSDVVESYAGLDEPAVWIQEERDYYGDSPGTGRFAIGLSGWKNGRMLLCGISRYAQGSPTLFVVSVLSIRQWRRSVATVATVPRRWHRRTRSCDVVTTARQWNSVASADGIRAAKTAAVHPQHPWSRPRSTRHYARQCSSSGGVASWGGRVVECPGEGMIGDGLPAGCTAGPVVAALELVVLGERR